MEENKDKKKRKLLIVLLALAVAGGAAGTAVAVSKGKQPSGNESQVESQYESKNESKNESTAESQIEDSKVEESSVDTSDMEAIVKEAYELETGASMEGTQTLTGVITAINTPYDSNYDNITVTIVVGDLEDNPIKCYRLAGEGVKDLAKGDTITVEGTLTNYNGTIEFAQGCQLKGVTKGEGGEDSKIDGDTAAIIEAAKALKDGDSLGEEVSLTGKITKIAKIYDYEKDGTVTPEANFYMDVDGFTIYCYATKGDHIKEIAVGDTATVKGYIKNYQGTIEFNIGTMTNWVMGTGDREQKTDDPAYSTTAEVVAAAQKLAEGEHLDNDNKYSLTGTITKISKIYDYTDKEGNVTPEADFYLTVDGVEFYCYATKGAQIKNIKKGDTATVNGSIQNYNGTLEIYIGTLTKLVAGTSGDSEKWDTPEKIVNGAYALENGDSTTPDEYTLTGKITKINTAWDSGYGNITVTIVVGDMTAQPIQCYRMKPASGVTGVDKLAVGDTITVKGCLSNYNGTIEFTQGCLCTAIEKQTINYTVSAVANDETMGTVAVEGYTITFTPADGYQFKDCAVTAGTATFTVDGTTINVTPTTDCTVTVNFEAKPVADCPYEVGTAYKFAVNQKNLEGAPTLYFNGTKSGNFFATTRNVDEAVDVYLEACEGGYRLYFMNGDVKTYIDVYEYQTGKLGIELNTEPHAVYEYNADLDIFTTYMLNKDSYLGIYSTFETISRSDLSYITGSNAANCDVTQHPARLVSVAPATTAKVTYMANGEEMSTETVDLNTTFTLPTEATAVEGFTFAGWSALPIDEETTDAPFVLTEASVTENTTFYAVYKKTVDGVDYYSTKPYVAPAYTVTAVAADETMGTVTVNDYAITVTPAAGYKYKSFEVTAGTAEATYANGVITVVPTSDVTVTVTFEAKTVATLVETWGDGAEVIIAIGGSVPTTETYSKGFKTAVAVIEGNALTVEDNYLILTVKAAGEGGQVYLLTPDGKYLACEATGNKLYTVDTADQYSLWQYVNKGTTDAPIMVVENLNALYGSGDSAKKQGLEVYNGNYTIYGYASNNTKWDAYKASLYALTERPLPTTATITYVVKGETFDSATLEIGTAFTLPTEAPIYKGYTFAGWATEEVTAETTTAPTFVTEATAEGNTTYYAVYKRIETTAPSYTAGGLMNGAVVVITETLSDGSVYAMSNNNGTSKAPSAVLVTVADGKITSEVPETLLWTVEAGESNQYSFKTGSDYLYCNDTNNGVRVGDGEKNVFTFKDEYLYNVGYIRYIGIYNKQDWRCYQSITTNIKNQTLNFYVQELGESTDYYTTAPAGFTVNVEVNDETMGTATVDGYEITVAPAAGYTLKDIVIAPEGAATYTANGNKITLDPSDDVTVTLTFEACDLLNEAEILRDGDKIVFVVGGKALTTTAGSKGFAGAAPAFVDSKLANEANYMVLTVSITDDGYMFMDANGKYMTTGATGNSLTFETEANEYSLWDILINDGNTLVSNKNAAYSGKKQALEFYNGNIYAYSYSDTTADFSIYNVKFYLVEEGTDGPVPDLNMIYIVNGENFGLDTIPAGERFTLPTNVPAIDGYTFVGWVKNEEISGETTEEPEILTVDVASFDATYYAVYKRVAEGATGTYTLATSADDLAAGKKVVIAAEKADMALGSLNTGNYFNNVAITRSSDKTTISFADTDAVKELILKAGAGSNTWAFYDEAANQYLSAINVSKNKMTEVGEINADSSFTVTISSDGTSMVSTTEATWKYVQYNPSSPRFSCYTSASQQGILLYVYKTDEVAYYSTTIGTEPIVPPVADPVISAVSDDETKGTVSLEGNVITVTPAEGYAYYGYTVTPSDAATVTVDGDKLTVTATADCTVTVLFEEAVPPTAEEIVNAAYALAPGEALGNEYTLIGKITAINNAYSSSYKNISVTIVVGDMTDKPIQCFRMKSDGTVEGIEDLAVGDTIGCTGILKNNSGTIEFDANCVLVYLEKGDEGGTEPELTTPEEIVNAAYALEPGTALSKEYSLTGVITKIDTAWSEQYKNMTVTMVIGDMTDKPIKAYRMTATDKNDADLCAVLAGLAVGDTITVTGAIKNYNGTIEFDTGCTGVYVSEAGGGDPVDPVITAASADEATGTVAIVDNVITATPADGYRVAGYTVNPEDAATVEADGNTFTVTATADCTVTISFEAVEVIPPAPDTVTVTIIANGRSTSEEFRVGTQVDLPTSAVAGDGYEFLGWVTTPFDEAALDSHNIPEAMTDPFIATEDITFYAMFKHEVTSAGEGAYTLVTSADQLEAGKKVVIAAADYDIAISSIQNGNNRAGVAITKSGSTISFTTAVAEFTLKAGSTEGTWAFYDANYTDSKGNQSSGYLYAASSSSNYLRSEAELSANSSFTISVSSSATTITATGSNTRNVMRYNTNNGTPIFACYASASQQAVVLYIYTATEAKTVTYYVAK